MKVIKKIGVGILLLPMILIAAFIIFELFGMCVNHISTGKQTKELKNDLADHISDFTLVDEESFTGNKGNGNHVDRISTVKFTTDLSEKEIIGLMDDKYDFQALMGAALDLDEQGNYVMTIISPAPFVDNIEGH